MTELNTKWTENTRVETGVNMKRGRIKRKACVKDVQPKCEIIAKSTKTVNEGPGQKKHCG